MTRVLCIELRRAGSTVMARSWSNLMKSVMEHFDDVLWNIVMSGVIKHCDDNACSIVMTGVMGHCDDRGEGVL